MRFEPQHDKTNKVSLCWAHTHFVGFVMSWLRFFYPAGRYHMYANSQSIFSCLADGNVNSNIKQKKYTSRLIGELIV